MSSCLSLLFFFLSVPEPLNPNPVISPPHIHRHLLLHHVCLHHVPSSVSYACASTLAPRSSSMPIPRSSSTLKRLGIAPSTRPSPPRLGTAVGTMLLLCPLLLRRWVHASPTASTCSSSANRLPLSFPLPM
jgi:hypothetical protein